MRQQGADIRDERVQREAQRVLEQQLGRGQTLGSGRYDVLLLQFVEQIGAQSPDHPGGAGGANNDDRDPDMGKDRHDLAPAPRRIDIARVHQPAHRDAEIDIREIDQQQRQQKARRREPEEAKKRQPVIRQRVLMRRGVDPDREGDEVGENDRRERHEKGQEQTVADHPVHRQVVEERIAHIALNEAAHPKQVLLPQRPVEPVLRFQKRDLGEVRLLALALQFGDVGREIVAGRQVDDDEDEEADGDQRRDHDQDPVDEIAEHRRCKPLPFTAGVTITCPEARRQFDSY